jgi:hypothetical protein
MSLHFCFLGLHKQVARCRACSLQQPVSAGFEAPDLLHVTYVEVHSFSICDDSKMVVAGAAQKNEMCAKQDNPREFPKTGDTSPGSAPSQ